MTQINIEDEVVDETKAVPQSESPQDETKSEDKAVDTKSDEYVDESDVEGFVTKDSGKRVTFDTGSVRDTQEGKARFDLIPSQSLTRLAELYARGAEKYGDNNWMKGQPMSRVYASLFRHLMQWHNGETDEDHMAAVAWNAFALMYFEEKRPDMDDIFIYDDVS